MSKNIDFLKNPRWIVAFLMPINFIQYLDP
jgi:hypothetical protein